MIHNNLFIQEFVLLYYEIKLWISMGTFKNHQNLYENFKKDAESENISEPSKAELYFLSLFHLIEACCAKNRVHIQKHQKIRQILEKNIEIFKDQTETIWRSFQTIENKLRPKFSYGFSWTNEDFKKLKKNYYKIEEICLKVLENGS